VNQGYLRSNIRRKILQSSAESPPPAITTLLSLNSSGSFDKVFYPFVFIEINSINKWFSLVQNFLNPIATTLE
jgi:hypothetical protein